jgi:hypothetical protein
MEQIMQKVSEFTLGLAQKGGNIPFDEFLHFFEELKHDFAEVSTIDEGAKAAFLRELEENLQSLVQMNDDFQTALEKGDDCSEVVKKYNLFEEMSPIEDAIFDGDLEAVQEALKTTDVNAVFGQNETSPLYKAMSHSVDDISMDT